MSQSDRFDNTVKAGFLYLQEIQFAALEYRELLLKGEPSHSTPVRFYFSSLIEALHSGFIGGGGGILGRNLRGVGVDAHLDRIEKLLTTPIGKTTLGGVIGRFRDRYRVHNYALKPRAGDSDIVRDAGLPWEDILPLFFTTFDKLVYEVVELGRAIDALIPDSEKTRPNQPRDESCT